MTTHTPGPWEARGLTIWEPGKSALSIAVVTQHEPNARANARLIAVAPDMLEVLRSLVRDDAGVTHEYLHIIRAKARAAIAKAEGRT
jgi:hypothetical protein